MTPAHRNWPEALAGLGLVVAGLVIAYEAMTLKVGPLYAKVGPAAFLWFSAALLCLCGAIVAYKGFAEAPVSGIEISKPLTILAGLALSVVLMEPLGFIPAATVIFVLTARGMGSERLLRDAIFGVLLSATAYIVFGVGLGLRLPLGSLFT